MKINMLIIHSIFFFLFISKRYSTYWNPSVLVNYANSHKEEISPNNKEYYLIDPDNYLSKKERERIEKMGLTLGCSGKMYILITKWRGGPRNTDAVLKFNQNTGLIEGNSFSHTTPYINISSSTISDNVTPKEFG